MAQEENGGTAEYVEAGDSSASVRNEPEADAHGKPATEKGPRTHKTGRELVSYFGVSATQTLVEFGTFTLLHLAGLPNPVPSVASIAVSGTYNFVMNRNLTFKSTSNLPRSIVLFILLYLWNFVFLQLMLSILPGAFGWDPVGVKFFTMMCQGIWGYLLSKFVIFR